MWRVRISVPTKVRAARIRPMRPRPDIDEYRRWQEATDGAIRLVTLSPEWPEAPNTSRRCKRGRGGQYRTYQGDRGADQDAVNAGATMSTHIGNGAHGELRRHPNYIWDQLAEDRLVAGLIVDGIHIGEAF